MYRMAVLAMCSSDAHLDLSKSAHLLAVLGVYPKIDVSYVSSSRCVMMCLVHDLAEAQGGLVNSDEQCKLR